MNKDQFIEEIYEIAFGDNAINRDFGFEEVIEKLQEFSDNALKWEDKNPDTTHLINLFKDAHWRSLDTICSHRLEAENIEDLAEDLGYDILADQLREHRKEKEGEE